ncbi:MAG: pantoate--beta-alanine ligase, partial [Bacteroidota bacterium]
NSSFDDAKNDCKKIIDEMTNLITSSSSGQIDYVSFADNNSLQELGKLQVRQSVLVSLAVKFGTTRLIDNTVLLV